VASQAKLLVDEASKGNPDKGTLRVFIAGLKSATQFLAQAVPLAVDIAGKIATLIATIHEI